MGLCVTRIEAHRLAQRGDAVLIVTGLNENQTKIVAGFGVIGTQPDRVAKRRCDLVAARAGAAEESAEHVVRFALAAASSASAFAGGVDSVCRSAATAPLQSGAGCEGGGTFRPASNCPIA